MLRTLVWGFFSLTNVFWLRVKIRGQTLASSSRDRIVKVWSIDGETLNLKQKLLGHGHSVWTVDFNANFLVSGSADHKVHFWRLCKEQGIEEWKKSSVQSSTDRSSSEYFSLLNYFIYYNQLV